MTDQPTLTADLTYLLDFCKRVRKYAAGHTRGGLGLMHQMAGEAIRRIQAQQEQLQPAQPKLALETD